MSEETKNPKDKVRELQRKLWVSAKRSRTRRFHALYDRIYRLDVLKEAWQRVRSRHGVGGIDGETIEEIEARGVEPYLLGIQNQLREGRYHPQAVKRVNIPKPSGLERIREAANHLHHLDEMWEKKYSTLGILTRYADDFIIQSKRWRQMKEGKERAREILSDLNLELEPDKSREVNLGMGKEGFNFLGHYLRKCHSIKYPGHYFLNRWPSQRSMAKVREKIKGIVNHHRAMIKSVHDLIPELNRVLRGWSNYFKSGNAARKFLQNKQMIFRYTYDWFQSLGIYQLIGCIQYPELAYSKA